MFAQDSIELLKTSGIDFDKFEKFGIDIQYFGELMIMSGLVLNEEIKWISFHSSYDFGYLLKTLTCTDLPMDEPGFLDTLLTYFPSIYDVKVMSVPGRLTDHYNPANKTVNLSPEVYESYSVAAAAIAAHECGHAVQHARAYTWLQLRSKLVPAVQFSSSIVNWILLAGVFMASSGNNTLLLVGIGLFAVTVVFSVITLPVEFDASRRALAWLSTTNVTTPEEYPKAKNALTWAAMTYVVAALAAVVTLVQYVLIFMGGRDRD